MPLLLLRLPERAVRLVHLLLPREEPEVAAALEREASAQRLRPRFAPFWDNAASRP